jgi:hypothetical protein
VCVLVQADLIVYSPPRHAYAGNSGSSSSSSTSSTKDKDIGILSSLLVAALAGVGNQLLTMPAGVVSTRMQASVM